MVNQCVANLLVVIVWVVFAIAADPYGCPRIVPRNRWAAKPPRDPNLVRPLVNATVVVIHHTDTVECYTHGPCQNQMREFQNNHQAAGYNDISYNFAVMPNGVVYEGRGWITRSDNLSAPGISDRAMVIAFQGKYDIYLPRERALVSYRALIKCGQRMNVFGGNRKLRTVAHRQLKKNIPCPGTALYRYMMTWPDFEPNPAKL